MIWQEVIVLYFVETDCDCVLTVISGDWKFADENPPEIWCQ